MSTLITNMDSLPHKEPSSSGVALSIYVESIAVFSMSPDGVECDDAESNGGLP